ncbi:MAG: hypothetical protein Q9N68_12980 [Gammaproteobacteria bacterium]|nr:hypothetical protein [Gammaproteobacteria bacterium]
MKIQMLSLTVPVILLLSGCFNSSSNSGGSTTEPTNSLSALVASSVNGDATSITDRVQLVTDIETLFGGVTTEPIDINDAETLTDVVTRLGG